MSLGNFPRVTTDVVFDVATVVDGAVDTLTLDVAGSGYSLGTKATTSDAAGTLATISVDAVTDGVAATTTVSTEGSGYTAGSETLSGGGGQQDATVTIVAKDGAAVRGSITLTVGGSGYTTGNTHSTTTTGDGDNNLQVDVVAEDVVTALTPNAPGTGYTDGLQTGFATTYAGAGSGLVIGYTGVGNAVTLPTVESGDVGTGYTNGDTVIVVGGNMDATVDLTVVSGVVQSVVIAAAGVTGAGYSAATTVGIDGGIGGQFTVDVIADGALVSATVTEGGYGWTALDVGTVSTGTGGTLSVATITDGIIRTISLGAAGSGYVGGDTETLTITTGSGTATATVTTVIDGAIATVTVTDGGTGFEVGDLLDASDITADPATGTGASFTVATETVSGSGIVATLSVTTAGSDYNVADELTAAGSSEGGVSDTNLYFNHDQYEAGGIVTEYTDATQSSYKPSIPPNVLGAKQVSVKTVLKADQQQLKVQQRSIAGIGQGSATAVTVYAEPTTVDRNGKVVGNVLRAEDITDSFRCTAAGFTWVANAPTGDADQGDYGYCAAATGTTYTAAQVNALDTDDYDRQFECLNNGLHWEAKESDPDARCIDTGTASAFSFANFVDTLTGVNYKTTSSAQQYAETTCKQYGFYWNKADMTCEEYTDPATLVTSATCIAEGHVWIAGVCYDGQAFGDGQSRAVASTSPQDPTVAPK